MEKNPNIRREKEKNMAVKEREIWTTITNKIDESKKLNDKNNVTYSSTFDNNINIRNRGNMNRSNMNKKETLNKGTRNKKNEIKELNTNLLPDSNNNNDKYIKHSSNLKKFSIRDD